MVVVLKLLYVIDLKEIILLLLYTYSMHIYTKKWSEKAIKENDSAVGEKLCPIILYGRSSRFGGCSVKKMFLKISKNSQENTCTRVPFLIKLQACFWAKLLTIWFPRNKIPIKRNIKTLEKGATFILNYQWWLHNGINNVVQKQPPEVFY